MELFKNQENGFVFNWTDTWMPFKVIEQDKDSISVALKEHWSATGCENVAEPDTEIPIK